MTRRPVRPVAALLAGLTIASCRGDGNGAAADRTARPTLVTRAARAPFAGLTEARVAVGPACLRVVVADSEAERTVGLMDRRSLGAYDGMLFVFELDSATRFTMQGTLIALDIGWYDAAGREVGRARMEPCPRDAVTCPTWAAPGRFRFALERPGGSLDGGPLGSCS